MKKILLFLSLLFSSLFSLMASSSISPKEAYEQSTQGKAIIIDVREKDEIAAGMVKGAQWFPLSKINSDKNWLTEFKKLVGDKKIYLYCRSGSRSGRVQSILKSQGVLAENIGGFMSLRNTLPTQK